MTWDETIARLYGLRRFGIEPGLERMDAALSEEGRPDSDYEVITVAGTNGKGTVASMVSAIYQAHGLRVGLYTSPHLVDVTERFRVDGTPLSQPVVAPTLERLLGAYGRREGADGVTEGLTFFEVTTLSAAVLFCEQSVDVAVFEVGLGGRLDAVNALDPQLTAVTTIGRDHTRLLGDSIEEIAEEKAGIFRSGVAAVVGPQEYPVAVDVLKSVAGDVGAPVREVSSAKRGRRDALLERRHRRTAQKVACCGLGENYDEQKAALGLKRWRWPGRLDVSFIGDSRRRLLMDAAHNAAALDALRREWGHRFDDVEAVVWTCMSDKELGDVEGFFEALDAPVWAAMVDNERTTDRAALKKVIPDRLWKGAMPTDVAMRDARERTAGDVLVFGSIYLLGEVYEALGRKVSSLCTYRDH